jgi:hypothetical protein
MPTPPASTRRRAIRVIAWHDPTYHSPWPDCSAAAPNSACPGFIATLLTAPVATPLTALVAGDPERSAALAARTMIGRNGEPADFGGVAVFLASPGGSGGGTPNGTDRRVTGHKQTDRRVTGHKQVEAHEPLRIAWRVQ